MRNNIFPLVRVSSAAHTQVGILMPPAYIGIGMWGSKGTAVAKERGLSSAQEKQTLIPAGVSGKD